MRLFGLRVRGFAKALVIFTAVFLVAMGLCGVSNAIESKHGWSWLGPNPIPNTALGMTVSTIDWVSLAAMTISGAGIGVSLVLWAMFFVYRILLGSRTNHAGK